MQYIESPNKYKGRKGGTIRVVVLHDMEAPEKTTTAESVARYFQNPKVKASAHLCVDQDSVVECVKPQDTAWHAPGANDDGYGVELAGFARQTEAEWLDQASKLIIHNAAQAVAPVMKAHGIPAKWLTDAELKGGKVKGLTTHAQVSRVFRKSDHTDPGAHFPADYMLAEIKSALAALQPAAKPAPAKPVAPAPKPAPAKLAEDGDLGPKTIGRWHELMRVRPCSALCKDLTLVVQKWLNGHGAQLVRDGDFGPRTTRALQKYLGVPQDGHMGPQTVRALQHRLNSGRF